MWGPSGITTSRPIGRRSATSSAQLCVTTGSQDPRTTRAGTRTLGSFSSMGSSREYRKVFRRRRRPQRQYSRSAIGVSEPRSPRNSISNARSAGASCVPLGPWSAPAAQRARRDPDANRQAHHQLATDRVTQENGTLQPACAVQATRQSVSSPDSVPAVVFRYLRSRAGQARGRGSLGPGPWRGGPWTCSRPQARAPGLSAEHPRAGFVWRSEHAPSGPRPRSMRSLVLPFAVPRFSVLADASLVYDRPWPY